MIQTEKLAFVNMSTYDILLTDARLFDLFMKTFIFNRVKIADVNSCDVASQKL